MIPNVLIPLPDEKPARDFSDHYRIWREAKEAKEPKFKLENTEFTHNPEWREQFWSLENARAETHWGWKVVSVLFWLSLSAAQYFGFRMIS